MAKLDALKVAVLAADGFEELELTSPAQALKEAGAQVDVISLEKGTIQAFRHHDKTIRLKVDRTLAEVDPRNYGALLLPGGALNADRLRVVPSVKDFIRAMVEAEKPIAAICHAPWELISAGVVRGKTLTGYFTIEDDIRNAGGVFLNQEVVVNDHQLVTSRSPDDLPAFNREMLHLFERASKVRAA